MSGLDYYRFARLVIVKKAYALGVNAIALIRRILCGAC